HTCPPRHSGTVSHALQLATLHHPRSTLSPYTTLFRSDITKGHDGRYYLAGNDNDSSPDIVIWVSSDLVRWEKHSVYTPDLRSTPDYQDALQRIGAPKLYYDKSTSQYILTWHTPHKEGTKDDPERYWASQRTLYVLSKDLKTFSDQPTKLFDLEMGTIDVFIRKVGDQ